MFALDDACVVTQHVGGHGESTNGAEENFDAELGYTDNNVGREDVRAGDG